jgi:ketosteroid isomerase-like protein
MIGLLFAAATAVAASAPAPDDAATLRALDQALLDAIAPGDRATWDRALSPDAVYVDEDGHVLDRAAFLATIEPLPRGLSGHISIADYSVRLHGDAALVVQRLDESEDYHGLPLHADYLVTETWLRQDGRWRLALVHAYVANADPPAIALPAPALDEYVGRYAGPGGMVYEIRREGDRLVGGRVGSPSRPLLAEMPDLFFVAGQPRIRKVFQRDAGHAVTGFIDRREGEDITWTRQPR